MVEIPDRAVQAAAEAQAEDDGLVWGAILESHREMYRDTARAVLEAAFGASSHVLELRRIQFGLKDARRYTYGGVWSERPVGELLSMVNGEENLVVERKLVVSFEYYPVAVTEHEGF